MAELKTKLNERSVTRFLSGLKDEKKRDECLTLSKIMGRATGDPPEMWGAAIVGFGRYPYKYESGRKGEWFLTGFAPRQQNLTLYIMSGFERHNTLMKKLGRFKTGKSCLYIKSLDDVDIPTLRKLIQESVRGMRRTKARD